MLSLHKNSLHYFCVSFTVDSLSFPKKGGAIGKHLWCCRGWSVRSEQWAASPHLCGTSHRGSSGWRETHSSGHWLPTFLVHRFYLPVAVPQNNSTQDLDHYPLLKTMQILKPTRGNGEERGAMKWIQAGNARRPHNWEGLWHLCAPVTDNSKWRMAC